jgi:HSP20 family protein
MDKIARRAAFDEFFDDYFAKALFVPPFACEDARLSGIKLDVAESDRDFTVLAEIPGVRKDDIAVDIDGETVSLSAEVKRRNSANVARSVCNERSYGRRVRTFRLPAKIDAAAVKTAYGDGILTLTLPKKPA